MANELRGVELRLERAHEHIDALKHESRMFMMELPQSYGWEIPDKPIDGEYIVRAKILRPPPIRLGMLAADAAHALRSALDMLAWELALKGENPPPDNDTVVGFPICSESKNWESDGAKRKIARITQPGAADLIHAFQPYRPHRTPGLMHVAAIDNWAKHKAIPNVLGFWISRLRPLTEFELTSFTIGAFEHGDEIGRARWLGSESDPDKHFRTEMLCHVAFAKGGPGKGLPIEFLESAFKEICDEILPAFQQFFPD